MRLLGVLFLSIVIMNLQAASLDSNVSAASGSPLLAPNSIVLATGSDLAPQDAAAPGFPLPRLPLPTELAGVSVQVVDSNGLAQFAPLYRVSPTAIEYMLPAGTAAGTATVTVLYGGMPSDANGQAQVQPVAPALFSANGDGQGAAQASAVRMVIPTRFQSPVTVFQCGDQEGSCAAVPIDPGIDAPVTLTFYGTGIRGARTVTATVGGMDAQVTFAGPDPSRPGVDEVIVPLLLALRGKGLVDVVVTADGVASNAVQVNVQ
jgi:uncharacterized protein (TIGR03437 family)